MTVSVVFIQMRTLRGRHVGHVLLILSLPCSQLKGSYVRYTMYDVRYTIYDMRSTYLACVNEELCVHKMYVMIDMGGLRGLSQGGVAFA